MAASMKEDADKIAAEEMAREKLLQVSKADKFTQNADEIVPGLFLGSENAASDPELLHTHGITHILVPAFTGQKTLLHEGKFTYLIWPIMDVPGFPIIWCFPAFVDTIERVLADPIIGNVLVHCANGVSRSPAVVAAYIMKTKNLDANSAFQFVRKKRHKISNSKFGEQLILWGKLGYKVDSADIMDKANQPAEKNVFFEELRRKYSITKQKKMTAAFSGELQTLWPAEH